MRVSSGLAATVGMSGTTALYAPFILMISPPTGRRAARPRRPPWAPISKPACGRDRCRSSGSLYTSPCPIGCLLRSRSIHTTPRRLSTHSYRIAPADHPVAVPEKYGSAGNKRPKTRFLANCFGNGGPMFGPLCRITSNYTADIFTMGLARYSYRWRKFSQVGQTYHWYTWDLYVRVCVCVECVCSCLSRASVVRADTSELSLWASVSVLRSAYDDSLYFCAINMMMMMMMMMMSLRL